MYQSAQLVDMAGKNGGIGRTNNRQSQGAFCVARDGHLTPCTHDLHTYSFLQKQAKKVSRSYPENHAVSRGFTASSATSLAVASRPFSRSVAQPRLASILRALVVSLALLCALALAGVPTRAHAAEASAGNAEADGVKIESFTTSWMTADTVDDGNPARLSLAPSTDDAFAVRMKLDLALSGQHAHAPGALRITVPKNILTYRDGSAAGTMTLSVPPAPDTSQPFNYTEQGDSYVITNIREIPAVASLHWEFAIEGLVPHLLNGNPAAYQSAPFFGDVELDTRAGVTLTKTSNEIDATFDTSEWLDQQDERNKIYFIRPADVTVSEAWPEGVFPDELRPDNPQDYVYVAWRAIAYPHGNQSYALEIAADPTASAFPGTRVLGLETERGHNVVRSEDGATATAHITQLDLGKDGEYLENIGDLGYRVRIYTAYPKSEMPAGTSLTIAQNVRYTLTPVDDPDEATTWEGVGSFKYTRVSHAGVGGHYSLDKWGGITFAGALNYLDSGQLTRAGWNIRYKGFNAPSTWVDENGDGVMTPDEVGKKPIDLVIDDDTVRLVGEEELILQPGDYEFTRLRFDVPQVFDWVLYDQDGKGYYETDLNRVVEGLITAGSYGYKDIAGAAGTTMPTMEVLVRIGEAADWQPWATVSWQGRTQTTQYADGTTATGIQVDLPQGTVAYRVRATDNHDGMLFVVKPTMHVLPSASVMEYARKTFEASDRPHVEIRNTARADVSSDGTAFGNLRPPDGVDYFTGMGMATTMNKSLTYENDQTAQLVRLHYALDVYEMTNLQPFEADQYPGFVDAGVIVPETSGTFYDLLPAGVIPDTDSIRLRDGDTVREVELKENYRGSGRTLMIVRADLAPDVRSRTVEETGSLEGTGDHIRLEFDATYSWENLIDTGPDLVNVTAFESGNERIFGTMPGFMGEPDDPMAGNHAGSAAAVAGVEDLMTDLDPTADKPAFVYARAANQINVNIWTVAALTKRVDVNGEGAFGTGLDDAAAKNVYEGGTYTYRLRTQNDPNTRSSDLVFYDELEGYVPGADKSDASDVQWRGVLESVDVSQLVARGAAPVIYYSTVPGLTLDDTDNRAHNDLSDTSIWFTTPPADLAQVTAIAVDASMGADGQSFVLGESQSAAVLVNMRAPLVGDLAQPGEEAQWYDGDAAAAGEAGLAGGAHAYNNVVRIARTISSETGATSELQLVREDYTKVGLLPAQAFDVPAQAQVELRKVLAGEGAPALADGTYSFELTPVGDAPMPLGDDGILLTALAATNAADGTITFGPLAFERPGAYRYEVREVAGTDPDVTYDAKVITVSVVAALGEDGTPQVTVSLSDGGDPGDDDAFTNTYAAPEVPAVVPQGTKVTALADDATFDGSFSFTVSTDEAGADVVGAGVSDGANGAITFTPITVPGEGAYTYYIREVVGGALVEAAGVDAPMPAEGGATSGETGDGGGTGAADSAGVTYDKTIWQLDVLVERGDDGAFTTALTYTNLTTGGSTADGVTFINNYDGGSASVNLEASKLIEGDDHGLGGFAFEVVDEATGQVVSTGASDESGAVRFGALSYAYRSVPVGGSSGGTDATAPEDGTPGAGNADAPDGSVTTSGDPSGNPSDGTSDGALGGMNPDGTASDTNDGLSDGGTPHGGLPGADGDAATVPDGEPGAAGDDGVLSDDARPDAGAIDGVATGPDVASPGDGEDGAGDLGANAGDGTLPDNPNGTDAGAVADGAEEFAATAADSLMFDAGASDSAGVADRSAGDGAPAFEALAAIAQPSVAIADDENAEPFAAEAPALDEGAETGASGAAADAVGVGAGEDAGGDPFGLADDAFSAGAVTGGESGESGVAGAPGAGTGSDPAVSDGIGEGAPADATDPASDPANGDGGLTDEELPIVPIVPPTDLGDHWYTIREVVGAEPCITYDATTYRVRVSVTDNGDGTISAIVAEAIRVGADGNQAPVTYPDGMTFVNICAKPTPPDPEKPDPEKPVDPDNPNQSTPEEPSTPTPPTPENPGQPGTPGGQNPPAPTKPAIPQTADATDAAPLAAVALAGGALAAAGVGLMVVRRRCKERA